MCDYSLHMVTSRPAKVSDKLVSSAFRNAFTRGFAAVGEPEVAVCLLPGTEVAFENGVTYDAFLGIISRKTGARVARFREINTENPNVHHHALEFPDGRIVLVHQLKPGQRATVLQLPSAVKTNDADEYRKAKSKLEEAAASQS